MQTLQRTLAKLDQICHGARLVCQLPPHIHPHLHVLQIQTVLNEVSIFEAESGQQKKSKALSAYYLRGDVSPVPLGRMAALCYLVSHERGPLGRAIYSQFSREPTIIDESGSFMIYAEVIFSLLRLLFSPSCRLCVWLRQDSEFHGIEYSTRETYHCWFRALPDEYDSSDKALHDAAITLVGHGKQEPI